jgi:GTPase SAR1 family protein
MPSFYRNAHAAVLVYDVTCLESFEKVQYWIDELKSKVDSDIIKILVGNKVDLEEFRQVTLLDGLECSNKNEIMFMEVSAKDDINITELFTLISKKIIENPNFEQESSDLIKLGDTNTHVDSCSYKC